MPARSARASFDAPMMLKSVPRYIIPLMYTPVADRYQHFLGALETPEFTTQELESIDRYVQDGGLNIWAASSQPE
jgi:hypothetical protein